MSAFLFNASDIKHDIDKLMHGFRQLPIGMERTGIRKAMNKALRPWRMEFRRIAPKKTGGLQRSIKVMTKFNKSSGRWRSWVGFTRNSQTFVRKSGKNAGQEYKKDGSHAVIVFQSTAERFTKAGESRGRMPAANVRAWEDLQNRIRSAGGDVFLGALRAELQAAVTKHIARLTMKTSRGR